MKKPLSRWPVVVFCGIGVCLILGIDRLLKNWCVTNIQGKADVPLIPGVLHLTYVENRGAAFGILQDARVFFVILGILVVGGIFVWAWRDKELHNVISLCSLTLVVGGTLGNLLDRAFQGYVVDMFEVEFFLFAVFNVADIALVCGGILLCLYMIFSGKGKSNEHMDDSNDA